MVWNGSIHFTLAALFLTAKYYPGFLNEPCWLYVIMEAEEWSPLNHEKFFPVFSLVFSSPIFRWLLIQNENRIPHCLYATEWGTLPGDVGQSKGLGETAQEVLGLCQGLHHHFLLAAGTADSKSASSKYWQCHLSASWRRSIFTIYRIFLFIKKKNSQGSLSPCIASKGDSGSSSDILATDAWRCLIQSCTLLLEIFTSTCSSSYFRVAILPASSQRLSPSSRSSIGLER